MSGLRWRSWRGLAPVTVEASFLERHPNEWGFTWYGEELVDRAPRGGYPQGGGHAVAVREDSGRLTGFDPRRCLACGTEGALYEDGECSGLRLCADCWAGDPGE